ncbi:glucose-6-phosphate isomerase, cytosolic 2-like [Hibiscus syriacus]|uniref:Glucose-6-phosphate isomerase, cytosolic 2-like n=1 Tax=Hibiscus syriacus TaxID=106335 RepID=A0A6A3CGZ8_HIBSY|nr:glucose-6-phosphate isomerase, cytosolic 2-like [Hibiscus syriacus]
MATYSELSPRQSRKLQLRIMIISQKLSNISLCPPRTRGLLRLHLGCNRAPKPVLLTAGSAAHNVRTARKAYDLHPGTDIVFWLHQYHDCGLMFMLLTSVSGATCVLTSPMAFVNRPRIWLEHMTEFKATCTPVPSFTLPLVSISPSYSIAENCTFVSTAWRNNNDNSQNSCSPVFPSHNKLLPSARLASDEDEEEMNIIVVNEHTHEPVNDGIEGEIWVSSPSKGYLGHPLLTQDIFKGKLSNKVNRCYVRTGDRGIVKGEERFLYVTGRCVEMIQLPNGQEIHPHNIETAAYNSCPQL